MTRSLLHTPRAVIVLLLLGVVFALTGTLRAQDEDILYLYYFESDDANLTDVLSKDYAFSTLAGETVTIMVYGLDQLVKPKLTLFNDQGVQVGQGFNTEEQPYATLLQFNASRNELYFFRVERLEEQGGLARVMIYEGDPLNQDLTLLDDMNPLLPSRTFMVAGRDTEEGLRVLVEVLDVPYYDEKPQIYASRGTLNDIPGVTDRFAPSDTFLWFNQDGKQVYFVNMRPTPEESTEVTENVPIRMFNVGNFFYFDYYFTVGAGSDPVRLLGRQECATAANRLECVRESPTFGRTETSINTPSTIEEEGIIFDPLPPIQTCLGGIGLNLTFTVAGSYSGSTCDDILNGSPFNDAITGGPGNDAINGNDGDDSLLGDEGSDIITGGLGNDTLRGGTGNDRLFGNAGNDLINGEGGDDFVDYSGSSGAVQVDLTDTALPIGGTGVGEGNDRLLNIENVLGSNLDDTLLGSSGDNLLNGALGNDSIDGGGGNDTLVGGEGDDNFTVGSAGGGNSQIYLGNGNDLVLLNGNGDAFISGFDFGGFGFLGNDTLQFFDTTSGAFNYIDFYGDDVLDFSSVTSDVQLNLSSSSNQTLYGTVNLTLPFDDPNGILGGSGDDTFTGSSNYKNCDFIDAGAGDDVVFATASNGFDCAGAFSALTNDVLMGGIGNDLLSYQNLSNVNVNLVAGSATKNGSMGDNISGFENVTGSSGNDTITGDAVANILRGIGGDDSIVAGAGDDTILVGLGSDTIDGGADVDLVNYSDAIIGRNIRLDGVPGSDLITNVENVIATTGNDTIRGNVGNNSIDANSGNDSIIVITGGFGTDDLVGGAGRDTLNGNSQAGNTTVNVNGSTGTYDNANGTVNFVTTEVIATGAGNDSFQIVNGIPIVGIPNISNVLTALGVDGGGGVNTFNFDLTAIGHIVVTPQVNDTLTVNNASAAGFSGTVINQWQEIIANLWVYLTAPINAQCGILGSTNFINGTPGNDTIGDALGGNLTSCQSDDVFNGFGSTGGDVLTYATTAAAGVTSLTFNIDDLAINQIATVTSTGYNIGMDTIIDFDSIVGTVNTDIFEFNPLSNTMNLGINGNGGNDSLDFGAVSDSVTLELWNNSPQNVYTNFTLTLVTPIRDVLLGTGNDSLDGSSGSDTIRGNLGNDEVFGFDGNDSFVEEAGAGGADSYYGGENNDTFLMTLDGASDNFSGNNGADSLTYNTGNPVVGTIGGSVLVTDGAGTDTISSMEQITTGTGADSFNVVAGGTNLTLLMQDGNDTFRQSVDAGAQNVDGGNGNNTAVYNDGTAENIAINGASMTAPGFGGTDTLNNFQNLILGGNDDTVQVNTAGVTTLIDMGAGTDNVFVYDNDVVGTTFDGGTGVNDFLYYFLLGGVTANLGATNTVGADTFADFSYVFIGNGDNTVTFNAGSGVSTLETGFGNDTLTVNSDTLPVFNTGGGNDLITLNQFSGNTTLAGSGGTDTLQYGGGVTNLTAALGATDTVTDGITTDELSGIEILILTGGADTINANSVSGLTSVNAGNGNDVINASSAGATTITGGLGNDTFNVAGTNTNILTGDAGDDVYIVTLGAAAQNFDAGTNTAIGDLADYSANGAMTITVNAATTSITGAFGTQTLTNFENLTASAGADTLTVINDGGIDSVNFGGGDDNLVVNADAGNNTFNGDAGTDTADYSAIAGNLSIILQANTIVGSDTLNNFEGLVLGNANYNVSNNAGSPFTSFTTGSGNDTFNINLDTLATINTGAGADSVQINAMTGDSTINTAGGVDTLNYNTGAAVLTVALGATNTVTNGVTTDTFTGVDVLTLDNANDIINANSAGGGITVNAGVGNDSFTVGATNTSILNGDAGNDTFDVTFNGTVARAFNGGTNTDVANYSTDNFTATVNAASVSIQVGASSADVLSNFETLNFGTGADTLTVVNDGGIDSVNFGSGADSLVVNADAGNNTFNGDAGTDTANYSAIVGNLSILLQATTVVGSDTLQNFESLVLGNADYTVTSNAGHTFTGFTTGTGDDTYVINNDALGIINSGAGLDSIQINSMTANSTFNLGGGADTLSYNTGATVLTVALGAGQVTDGTTTDTFTGLEVLTLNSANDIINADSLTGGVTVNAGAGADSFTVSATDANTLNGDAGNDTYNITFNGTVARSFNAGTNTDLADYTSNAINFTGTVNGTTTTLTVGAADTLIGFETLDLGSGADTITVLNDNTTAQISLGAGTDSLIVSFDGGNNTYDGGLNADTANYSAITGNLAITLQANTVIGSDTLLNFESLVLGNADYAVTENAGSLFTSFTTGTGDDNFIINNDALGTITTGAGDDIVEMNVMTNNTTVTMGAGVADELVYNTTSALTVALGAGTVTDGVTTDTYTGVEILTLDIGNDTIDATAATSGTTVNAGAGNDSFTVGATNGDTLNGNFGDDTYTVTWSNAANSFDAGTETVADLADYSSNADNFTVVVGATTTIQVAASPFDTLTDFEVLNLGTGNDSVAVNTDSGLSTIGLGGGDDSITISSYASTNTFTGGAGTDTLVLAGGTGQTVTLGATNTIGVDTFSEIEAVTFTTQADTVNITNPTEVTTVNASDGNDTINLNNNGSVTTLNAGNGADSIVVTDAGTLATVNGDAGNDTFVVILDMSDTTFDGGADIDTATYASATANLAVAVNATPTVSNGVNTDTLQSVENITTGSGNDVFTIDLSTITSGTWSFNAGGSAAGNQFVFTGNYTNISPLVISLTTASGGTDTLDFSSVTGSGVTINTNITGSAQTIVTNVQILLNQIINTVIGTNQADTITGSVGADTLNGLGGNDTIRGGAGNDVLLGGAGNDTLVGGVFVTANGNTNAGGADGTDSINGGIGDDSIIGGNSLNCQGSVGASGNAIGDGADSIYGGEGNDTIQGDGQILNCSGGQFNVGAGADTIYGGSNNGAAGTAVDGNDSINGQGGADSLFGGNNNTGGGTGDDGSDTIVGGTNSDLIFGGNDNTGGGDGDDIGDSITLTDGTNNNDTAYGGNSSGGTGVAGGTDTFNSSDGGDDTFNGNKP